MFIEIETEAGRRILNSVFIVSVEPLGRGCSVRVASGGEIESFVTELSYEAVKSGLRYGGVEVVTRQSDEASLTALRPVAAE